MICTDIDCRTIFSFLITLCNILELTVCVKLLQYGIVQGVLSIAEAAETAWW